MIFDVRACTPARDQQRESCSNEDTRMSRHVFRVTDGLVQTRERPRPRSGRSDDRDHGRDRAGCGRGLCSDRAAARTAAATVVTAATAAKNVPGQSVHAHTRVCKHMRASCQARAPPRVCVTAAARVPKRVKRFVAQACVLRRTDNHTRARTRLHVLRTCTQPLSRARARVSARARSPAR